MGEKFSIAKTKIDIVKLCNYIEKYLVANNTKPYLFMNKNTIDELISQVGYNYSGLLSNHSSDMCGYFRGHKVFCDNTLNFGEVEIR